MVVIPPMIFGITVKDIAKTFRSTHNNRFILWAFEIWEILLVFFFNLLIESSLTKILRVLGFSYFQEDRFKLIYSISERILLNVVKHIVIIGSLSAAYVCLTTAIESNKAMGFLWSRFSLYSYNRYLEYYIISTPLALFLSIATWATFRFFSYGTT